MSSKSFIICGDINEIIYMYVTLISLSQGNLELGISEESNYIHLNAVFRNTDDDDEIVSFFSCSTDNIANNFTALYQEISERFETCTVILCHDAQRSDNQSFRDQLRLITDIVSEDDDGDMLVIVYDNRDPINFQPTDHIRVLPVADRTALDGHHVLQLLDLAAYQNGMDEDEDEAIGFSPEPPSTETHHPLGAAAASTAFYDQQSRGTTDEVRAPFDSETASACSTPRTHSPCSSQEVESDYAESDYDDVSAWVWPGQI